jgi:hypothetical protein
MGLRRAILGIRSRTGTPVPPRPGYLGHAADRERRRPIESAIVVRIPETERLVGRFRADLDVAAALGVPAHVTVLAPFVPPASSTAR